MDAPKNVDLDTIRRCQSGELGAFDSLYQAYGDSVWRLCHRMVHNREDAEDLAQEAWLTVWRRIGNFRCESAFTTWLYRVASNVCLQWLRQRRSESAGTYEEDSLSELLTPRPDPLGHLRIGRVLGAVAQLPDSLKLPLVLRADKGLSYSEIAEVVGCTTAAVKMRICRARTLLAQAVEEEQDDL